MSSPEAALADIYIAQELPYTVCALLCTILFHHVHYQRGDLSKPLHIDLSDCQWYGVFAALAFVATFVGMVGILGDPKKRVSTSLISVLMYGKRTLCACWATSNARSRSYNPSAVL